MVSVIGFRADGEKIYVVAVNWDEDAVSELDKQISATLGGVDGLGEKTVYCQVFSKTISYKPERLKFGN